MPRSNHWWETTVLTFDDDRWLDTFRVRKGTLDFICSKVEEVLAPSPTPVIPNRSLLVEKIVAIALYK